MDAADASAADMGRRPDGDADPLALDDETVERLLAGALPAGQAPPEYAAVAALLAAMAAPPSQEELVGHEAALAELRTVTMTRAAAHRPTGRRRRRRVGLAAVAVAGALATGGVAGAATGHLPEPVRTATRSILVTVGGGGPATTAPQPASSAHPPGSGHAVQPPPSTAATVPAPGAPGDAAVAANPDLKGLCGAYLAGKGADNGKKLNATAVQALARAAGGEDKVQAYCQRLQPPRPKPDSTKPTHPRRDPKPNDQQPETTEHPGKGQGNPQATRSQSR